MEPMKPEARQQLTRNNSQATPQDVEEYERLLSQRFMVDPSLPTACATANSDLMAAPTALSPAQERETRLKVLYQKLYLVER